ncbi:MAG: hypothetical protein PHU71_04180 [Candidatus Gracilibacteria bacterium]|nr:hypothetical protein [Candidatus Gracilibacteria bacterium]
MSYNLYMLGIAIANIFSWSAFALVVTKLSPCVKWLNNTVCSAGNTKALIAFYATLFLALTGLLAIIGFYLRVYWKKNELYYENVNIAFRQGILVSLAICGLLALQSFRVLTWWDSLILVLLLLITEFSFLKRNAQKKV